MISADRDVIITMGNLHVKDLENYLNTIARANATRREIHFIRPETPKEEWENLLKRFRRVDHNLEL